jgi:hypothetical protein
MPSAADEQVLHPTTDCDVCCGPYERVSDDPSPSHPSCAPADPVRFRGCWSLLRWGTTPAQRAEPDPDPIANQPGVIRAVSGSNCPGCGWSILPGDVQALADLHGRRCWVCRACATGEPRAGPGPAPSDLVVPLPRLPEPDPAPVVETEPT